MDKENIGGKVMGLATMVDYQDGSVVSRTLVERSGGTVTMFAFDKGQGLSEHTAPFDALVVVVDGEAEVSVSGIAQNVLSGQIILMPANDPHALRAVRRFKMMLVMVKS